MAKPLDEVMGSYSDANLEAMISKIKEVEPLLAQGLLREKELSEISARAHRMYERSIDHDSIQYRKYDRSRRENTRWREVSRSGYVNADDGAELLEIKQQIIELLNLRGVEVPSEEVFLPPNSEYVGRVELRNLLSSAEVSIDINDDYLFSVNKTTKNIELLHILHPYLGTSLRVKVRLLGSSKDLHAVLVSDINAFLKQNKDVEVKGFSRNADGVRETHDRFIIVDSKTVYKVGTSIKDLGVSQSSIDKVNDPDIGKKYIEQFDAWWQQAKTYPGIE